MDKIHAESLRQTITKIENAKTLVDKSRIALHYMQYSAPILLEAIENHECGKE